MKYELDVLAALIQLHKPTTQDVVAETGISERKVQNVIKALQSDLNIKVKKTKDGRLIRYSITGWGVFESGEALRQELAKRPLNKTKKSAVKLNKTIFYESVKMSNYKESSRLEGITIHLYTPTRNDKISNSIKKNSLIKKYSRHKKTSNTNG